MHRPLVRISIAAVALLICCGDTSGGCNNSNTSIGHIGPTGGQIAAAGVGVGVVVVGTIVLVHVHNTHHNVNGCVMADSSGIELRTADNKLYRLTGDVAAIHEGDFVQLHGDRVKKTKDLTGDQVFQVTKLKRDKGPFKLPLPASAKP